MSCDVMSNVTSGRKSRLCWNPEQALMLLTLVVYFIFLIFSLSTKCAPVSKQSINIFFEVELGFIEDYFQINVWKQNGNLTIDFI